MCSPIIRHSGSIAHSCPLSHGLPTRSERSPCARVTMSPPSYARTQKPKRSVLTKSSSCAAPGGRHTSSVAIRPYSGTSCIGSSPSGVTRKISRCVHFDTTRLRSSGAVKWHASEWVTLDALCAVTT